MKFSVEFEYENAAGSYFTDDSSFKQATMVFGELDRATAEAVVRDFMERVTENAVKLVLSGIKEHSNDLRS